MFNDLPVKIQGQRQTGSGNEQTIIIIADDDFPITFINLSGLKQHLNYSEVVMIFTNV